MNSAAASLKKYLALFVREKVPGTGACGAVLVIAFGGPTSLEEVPAFVTNVLGGRRLPPARMAEIVERYRLIGGRSPINEVTFRLAERLAEMLRFSGDERPVYVGMRDGAPPLEETLRRMADDGVRRAIGIILAPHQAEASWGRYQTAVATARQRIGASAPEIAYAPAWFDHPDFIEAVVARVRDALERVPRAERPQSRLIFTAHSIPVAMAESSSYAQQVTRSAELVAARCDDVPWTIAYQSRSAVATQPWLEPDLHDVIRQAARDGARTLVVVPIGFVCDHLEVLYDLDIAGRAVAEAAGVRFLRAATVAEHPAFLRMLVALVTTDRPICAT